MAVRLPTRGSWRACGEASGSSATLPSVEDIGLPSRRQGGLGHGEDTLQEGGSELHDEVGPVGPDGKEIPMSLVYGQVELAAKYSQRDCKLDSLLDGIEEEYSQSI